MWFLSATARQEIKAKLYYGNKVITFRSHSRSDRQILWLRTFTASEDVPDFSTLSKCTTYCRFLVVPLVQRCGRLLPRSTCPDVVSATVLVRRREMEEGSQVTRATSSPHSARACAGSCDPKTLINDPWYETYGFLSDFFFSNYWPDSNY